jgi:hypothetical protein
MNASSAGGARRADAVERDRHPRAAAPTARPSAAVDRAQRLLVRRDQLLRGGGELVPALAEREALADARDDALDGLLASPASEDAAPRRRA